MHLTVGIPADDDDVAITREAAALNITAQALSGYYQGEDVRRGLVLGYAAYGEDALKRAASLLEQAVGRALAGGQEMRTLT